MQKIQILIKKYEKFEQYSTDDTLQTFFKGLKELECSKTTSDEYEKFNNKLTFFVGLLPKKDHSKYLIKNWMVELGVETLFRKLLSEAREIEEALSTLPFRSQKIVESLNHELTEKMKMIFFKKRDFRREDVEEIIKELSAIQKLYESSATLKDLFQGLCRFEESRFEILGLSNKTRKALEELRAKLDFVSLLSSAERENYSRPHWAKKFGFDLLLSKHLASANDMLKAPEIECVDSRLIVRGYHVRARDVYVAISTRSGIKDVTIQALHTFTIDNDLAEKFSGVNLTMIAPKIAVIGTPTINLSGSNAGSPSPKKAANGVNGAAAPHPPESTRGLPGDVGGRGTHGVPGLPGTSAGNLLIVCDTFSDHERLRIQLNGGNGGSGQDGGDGGTGGDGGSVTWGYWRGEINGYDFDDISRHGWEPISPVGHHQNGQTDQTLRLFGGDGGSGGNGGQGGQGGDFGYRGEYRLVVAGKVFEFRNIQTNDGTVGTDGTGGAGGVGGQNGRYAEGVWHEGGNPDYGWNGHYRPQYRQEGRGGTGSQPSDVCGDGRRSAERISRQNFALVLLNYRKFLAQKTSQHPEILGDFLGRFARHCGYLGSACLTTTVRDLLLEAEALEHYASQSKQEKDQPNLAPFYHSLIARTSEFALASERSLEEMKVLEYLYVALLGKIAAIHASSDRVLIMDLDSHLDNLSRDFEALRKLQTEELRAHYQRQYSSLTEHTLGEVRLLLEQLGKNIHEKDAEITPEIIHLRSKSVTPLEGSVVERVSPKNRDAFQELLRKKTLLNFLGVALHGFSMIVPPMSQVVTEVIKASCSTAINFSDKTALDFMHKVVDMALHLKRLVIKPESIKKYQFNLCQQGKSLLEQVILLARNMREIFCEKGVIEQCLSDMDGYIAKLEQSVEEFQSYLKKMDEPLEAYFTGMVSQVTAFNVALRDSSLIPSECSAFELRQFFEDTRVSIKTMIGQCFSDQNYVHMMRRFEAVFDLSLHACLRIHAYQAHIVFLNYMMHVESPGVMSVIMPSYKQDVERLRAGLQQSVVEEIYGRAVEAIKQWAFPFAERFLVAVPDLNTLEPGKMVVNLKRMRDRLKEYRETFGKIDRAIVVKPFGDSSNEPFFSWSYKDYPLELESLLKGERMLLKADITDSPFDAVKFNRIGIELHFENPEKQAEWLLFQNHFNVSLEHSGISYYKYRDQTYQLASDEPIELEYSFKMDSHHATSMQYSGLWAKMVKGDILVSPYAVWAIHISPIKSSRITPTMTLFDKFKDSLPYLSVRLKGQGVYVNARKVKGDLHMSHHYRSTREFIALPSISSPARLRLDKHSGTREENTMINVSGQGNNCGLFALALGIKLALTAQPILKASMRMPEFFESISREDLERASVRTEAIGKHLRAILETALLQDELYKRQRLNSFIDCCVAFLDNRPPAVDMSGFIRLNQDFINFLKSEWQTLSVRKEGDIKGHVEKFSQYFTKVLSETEKEHLAAIHKALSEEVLRPQGEGAVRALLERYSQDLEDSLRGLINARRLFAAALVQLTIGAAENRGRLREVIKELFMEKAFAISAGMPDGQWHGALLAAFLQNTNFDERGGLIGRNHEAFLSNFQTNFLRHHIMMQWDTIYNRYTHYLKNSTEMLTADELGCLSRYLHVQLSIQFNDLRSPYRSYQERTIENLHVTLSNPSLIHWMVVQEKPALLSSVEFSSGQALGTPSVSLRFLDGKEAKESKEMKEVSEVLSMRERLHTVVEAFGSLPRGTVIVGEEITQAGQGAGAVRLGVVAPITPAFSSHAAGGSMPAAPGGPMSAAVALALSEDALEAAVPHPE